MAQRRLFIFGMGYSASRVARRAVRAGFALSAAIRNPARLSECRDYPIEVYPFEDVPDEALMLSTHILAGVPTQEGIGDPAWHRYGTLLQRHGGWLGYLSTTGVYGDHSGAWVDEDTPPQPNNARLERRLEAERQWQLAGGHVFRLAGIYGPGRSAIDDVREGTARRVDKPGQVFSRIHVDDIAQTVMASMTAPSPGRLYNVCDDEPAPAADVVAYACALLHKEPPPLVPFAQAVLSPMGLEFYSANRRVSNARIKRELGVRLLYPTYREGLQAILGTGIANDHA